MNLKEFTFHPTEKNWILASSWTNCEDKLNCVVSKDLYLSQNFGQKWKLLTKYVVQFAW